MALYLRKKLDNKAEIGVWQITETEEELMALSSIPSDEMEEISFIRSESMRKQRLAVRALLEESGAWEDWTYATTLEAGDPLMQSSVEAVRELLGYTPAQMEEMLRQCVAR